MAELVKNSPGFLRNGITSLAVVNNCKVKRTVDESIGVKKANPLPKGAKVVRDCIRR